MKRAFKMKQQVIFIKFYQGLSIQQIKWIRLEGESATLMNNKSISWKKISENKGLIYKVKRF